jgi:regulatory protein
VPGSRQVASPPGGKRRRARPGERESPGEPGDRGERVGPGDRGEPGDRSERVGSGGPGGRVGSGGPDGSDGPGDPESVARLICLRLLTSAPKTRAQLAAALRRRGVPEAAANAVLGRFADVGLIDDAMFARVWVESRHHGRGLARRALAAELAQRGVEPADIRAAVDRLSPESELATARALVEHRLASTRSQPAPARARRLVGMLARKGYPAGLAYRVVREALEADGEQAVPGCDDDDAFAAEMAEADFGSGSGWQRR